MIQTANDQADLPSRRRWLAEARLRSRPLGTQYGVTDDTAVGAFLLLVHVLALPLVEHHGRPGTLLWPSSSTMRCFLYSSGADSGCRLGKALKSSTRRERPTWDSMPRQFSTGAGSEQARR